MKGLTHDRTTRPAAAAVTPPPLLRRLRRSAWARSPWPALLTDAFTAQPVGTPACSHDPLAPKPPHFAPKAKRVIHLFMAGAPSQLDLFDYKPSWPSWKGKPLPPSVIGGQRYAFIRPDAAVLGPRFKFARHGQMRGRALGDAAAPGQGGRRDLPHQVGPHRPVQPRPRPDLLQHRLLPAGPAQPRLVGDLRPGLARRATCRRSSSCPPAAGISGGSANWSSGFLPTVYTGVRLRNQGDPILNVSSPPGVDRQLQRDSLDLIGSLNRRRLASEGDPEIATRIAAYEMAFRLQTSAPS